MSPLRHRLVFALRRVAAIDHEHGQSPYNTGISRLSCSKQRRWCRRGGGSNDTRLLILRNLLQTYERQNRTTRCMPASYVQNHVQRNRSLRHHICAFRNSSSLPFCCCALRCLSGLPPNLLSLNSIRIVPASAETRAASFKWRYRTRP